MAEPEFEPSLDKSVILEFKTYVKAIDRVEPDELVDGVRREMVWSYLHDSDAASGSIDDAITFVPFGLAVNE